MAKENITPGWDENLINIGEDPSRYGFTAPTGASTQAIVYYDRQGNKVNYGSPDAYFTSPTGGYTYQGFPSGGVENTGLIYEDDPIFQDPYLVQLDEGVKVNPKDYGWKKSAYDYYLGGGFDAAQDDFVTPPVQNFTGGEMIDTGGGGAQIPGAIDTLVTTPAEEEMTFQDVVDSDANVGFIDAPVDTIMPPMLTPDMGMDTVVDTTPDYSNVGTSNPRLTARGTPISEMGTRPPDFVAGAQTFTDPEPSGGRLALGRADITPEMGTIPPDTIGPQPINLIDPVPTGGRLALGRADVTPEVETVPGPFDYLQPEETYADLLDRTPMNLVRTPGGEIAVDPETGVVQPGTIGDIVEEPEYSVTRPAGIDAPMISPEQTTFGDPVDVEQGFTADPIDFSAPGTLADPAETQDVESLPAQEQNTLLSNVANQLGGIWDSTNKTIDIAGQKINPFVAGVKGAINKYIFGGLPVTFVFDALGAMGLEPGYSDQTKAAQYMGLAKEGETQDIYGINTQSMFGDYDQYNIDRVEELEDIVDDQLSRGLTNTIQMRELEDRKSYNLMASGDIDDDPTGDAEIAEIVARDDRIDAGIEAADEEPGPSGDGPQGVDAGTADVQDFADIYEPPPAPTYSPPSYSGQGGQGGGGGSNIGGGQQTSSGGPGGYSGRGWGGGWGWSKGGIVSLKNGKR